EGQRHGDHAVAERRRQLAHEEAPVRHRPQRREGIGHAHAAVRAPCGRRDRRGGADDGSRTRDLWLGKPTLYQLSYVRKAGAEMGGRMTKKHTARRGLGHISGIRPAGVAVLVDMEHNTTSETGHRGLWIIVGAIALVAVIALVYLTG